VIKKTVKNSRVWKGVDVIRVSTWTTRCNNPSTEGEKSEDGNDVTKKMEASIRKVGEKGSFHGRRSGFENITETDF
jgi:hypothetical protein